MNVQESCTSLWVRVQSDVLCFDGSLLTQKLFAPEGRTSSGYYETHRGSPFATHVSSGALVTCTYKYAAADNNTCAVGACSNNNCVEVLALFMKDSGPGIWRVCSNQTVAF